jgi:hypothetical protein
MGFDYWKTNKFKILVGGSITIIVILWLYNESSEGDWSKEVRYDPSKVHVARRIPTDSRGELECRRVLEKIFKAPCAKARPAFLYNQVTGERLEIDCYNEDLKLGCEYDGRQHTQYVKQFHKNYEAFRNQQYRDVMKYRACEDRGVYMIRVPYTVKHENIEKFIVERLIELGFS